MNNGNGVRKRGHGRRKMKKIKRIKDFTDGDFKCIKCGKEFHLWFNGGELDAYTCSCGLYYRTECIRTDLVIYKDK